MKTSLIVVLCGALLGLASSALAQSTPPPLPPESHQFDFWIGEWNVTTPDGKPAGLSKIESVSSGAALLENWTGLPVPAGGNGKSLNVYNRAKKQWQQFWVGSGGGVLELAGGLVNGRMVLTGEHRNSKGQMIEKITWTPNADGSVRQHWEQSTDGGQTWTDAFDGLYRKKA
ncbi:MAG: hypothetical protein PSU94_14500 [Lacunisphaera sp.]|nr:hypothetical protein [Lacunisphaera sp.]